MTYINREHLKKMLINIQEPFMYYAGITGFGENYICTFYFSEGAVKGRTDQGAKRLSFVREMCKREFEFLHSCSFFS